MFHDILIFQADIASIDWNAVSVMQLGEQYDAVSLSLSHDRPQSSDSFFTRGPEFLYRSRHIRWLTIWSSQWFVPGMFLSDGWYVVKIE